MRSEDRKRLERRLQKLLAEDGDHCTVCRRRFVHGDKTIYGRVAGQRPAVTGECCADAINASIGVGVYTDRSYDIFPSPGPGEGTPSVRTPEELSELVDQVRVVIAETDARAAAIGASAGLGTKAAATFLRDTAWKADDAAWFAARQRRSHRLRSLLPGEFEPLPSAIRNASVPDGHELQVLVRQVEPGQRVRTFFARNLGVEIPDDEAVIHALFDLVSQRSAAPDDPITADALATLAHSYSSPGRGS